MFNSTRARFTALAMFAAIALAACSGNSGKGNGPLSADSDGTTHIAGDALVSQLDALPKATLTKEEEAGLLRMREEETLAHDVYQTLNEKWNLRTFANIAGAESTHADAIKVLLDRYGLEDPNAGRQIGEFKNAELQSLYNQLVDQGNVSLVDALTVGATVEEVDIADLQALATTTPDIAMVYDSLEKGSRNHLRAFTKQLTKNSATFTPSHISQADYDAIIGAAMERGSGK